MTVSAPTTGYAPVNGLRMYHEVHGEGRPTLLLHGAYGTIPMWGDLLTGLAAGRQVIAVEQQAHGRTVDVDRPIRYETMADDCATLLDHLGVDQADVVGYSMGANVGLRLAIQHPAKVRRLVSLSGNARMDAYGPEMRELFRTLTPEFFVGTPIEEGYRAVAPDPDAFLAMVAKVIALDHQDFDWMAELPAIQAPTLVVCGDADALAPEHAVEMLRALGGGTPGDYIDGHFKAQLAILPNTAHIGVVMRTDPLLAVIPPFLDAPDPAAADVQNGVAEEART